MRFALLDPQSRHYAVPDWHDAADVPGVLGHQPVVLTDEGGVTAEPFPVGSGCDVPAPKRVVAQPQATDPNALPRRAPAVRVTVLVDVAVHDVEVACFLRELTERITDPVP